MKAGVGSLIYAAETDKGIVRELNEDSCAIIPVSAESSCVFVIADGMGGHNCGELASRLAVEYIKDNLHIEACTDDSVIPRELENIVKKANAAVYEKSLESDEVSGMGTTLTMAVITGKKLTAAHVGDSRLYLVRAGSIKQLTEDHSYIGELVRQGTLTKEEAEKHPRKNVITRAIGCTSEILVDIISYDIEDGDIFVLCTDGLTNMVSEQDILQIVGSSEPEAACAKLIEAANRNGGEDNITVIVIKCE